MNLKELLKKDSKELAELARKALESGNPYVKKSVRYERGDLVLFLYAEKLYSKEELDEAYLETASKDVLSGYKDRIAGYYDKWYRYCRMDEGKAYDLGVILAASNESCSDEFHIIECMH